MNIEILPAHRDGVITTELSITKNELLTGRNTIRAMESFRAAVSSYLGLNNYVCTLSDADFETAAINFFNLVCHKQFDMSIWYIFEDKEGNYEFQTFIVNNKEPAEVPNEFSIRYAG